MKEAFNRIADRRLIIEQKALGEVSCQTEKIYGINKEVQYTDYSEQFSEAIKRLVKVIETNNLHFKQKKLRMAVEAAVGNETTKKLKLLGEKTNYLEAKRHLTDSEAASYRHVRHQNFSIKIAEYFEEKIFEKKCMIFDKFLITMKYYDKKLKALKKIMQAENDRVNDVFFDFIKTVKERTIPLYHSRLAQGCICLDDFMKTHRNLTKSKASFALKNFVLSGHTLRRSEESPSPRNNQTKRGMFAASRITGSFMMTLAQNVNEGADKLLGLFEKVKQDTFG